MDSVMVVVQTSPGVRVGSYGQVVVVMVLVEGVGHEPSGELGSDGVGHAPVGYDGVLVGVEVGYHGVEVEAGAVQYDLSQPS